MEIRKIVITGGPCGGKSTAFRWVRKTFEAQGWAVLCIPETASELLSGGVPLFSRGSNMSFQCCNLRLQLEKEAVFTAAARGLEAEKVLLLCDRGGMDNKAYMTPEDFNAMLENAGITEEALCRSYDAVFHLVSAAVGAQAFYTTENNDARSESPEEAAALDARTLRAWENHPYRRVIDNSTGFEGKMRRLTDEIGAYLAQAEKEKSHE